MNSIDRSPKWFQNFYKCVVNEMEKYGFFVFEKPDILLLRKKTSSNTFVEMLLSGDYRANFMVPVVICHLNFSCDEKSTIRAEFEETGYVGVFYFYLELAPGTLDTGLDEWPRICDEESAQLACMQTSQLWRQFAVPVFEKYLSPESIYKFFEAASENREPAGLVCVNASENLVTMRELGYGPKH